MTTKRITIKQVKEELDGFKQVFEGFVNNDFKHLKEEIQGLRKRLDKLVTAMFAAVISTSLMLVGLIVNLILIIAKGK